jgi:hypothetical protein
MKIDRIEYKKLVNMGNFEHESLGISIALDDGDNPHEAVKRAKAFVNLELTNDKKDGDGIPF